MGGLPQPGGLVRLSLDHIVVAAHTLEQGCAYVERALGVRPAPGGRHLKMGTHNSLLSLGEGVYLEVIALDPEGTDPGRPRWFGLDNPRLQAELSRSPRLLHWVARTDDIHAAVAVLPELGKVHRMSRGDLEWDITIPDDGELLEHGLIPTVISWGDTPHPTTRLPDSGCRLVRLRGLHPHPERVEARLKALGTGLELEASPAPGLLAQVQTPSGLRLLR
ncbi:Glyoxalase-like domain protein [Calidithermus roseus]|uniref:Glyoxalase-like domain protein n=1 Tax=Calidithermus roseus TaxID=1644118 RepID=A0A399ERL9_9DEIN|nr:Glyoxalase-like domain protein [Calidithermus roseus]